MKITDPRLLLTAALGILVGCATPFRAPADAAHIRLDRVDSRSVIVEKIWLGRKDGPLAVEGYVIKRLSALSTAQAHLDVTVFDEAGRVLHTSVERFNPQNIQRRVHRPGHARYRVELEGLPAGVARIEVRAHEDDHPGAS